MKAKDRRAQEQRGVTRRKRGGGSGLRRDPASYGDKSGRVVYFAAEGGVTEYDYADHLQETYGGRDGQQFRLHQCHPGHLNGLRPLEVVDQVRRGATSKDDEMWALFDRDKSDNRDTEIPQAMSEAAKQGVQVALSHPSFELWLLLHFQDFTSEEGGVDDAVKDRLRKHPDADGFDRYDTGSGQQGKGLNDRRKAALGHKGRDAARRAGKLVDTCPKGDCRQGNADSEHQPGGSDRSYEEWVRRTGHTVGCDPLHRDPSSDVWRLLRSLGIA